MPFGHGQMEGFSYWPTPNVLGLIIDTNRMTVSIPLKYRTEVLALLESTWHQYRRRFKVSEAQKLTGKLARLAEGANWVFHLLSHLYSSIAYALSENKKLLSETSQEFRDMISIMRTNKSAIICKDLVRHTSFAMKRAAKMTHHASYEYNISTTMRAESARNLFRLTHDDGDPRTAQRVVGLQRHDTRSTGAQRLVDARLQAQPTALRCLDCQTRFEST